MTAYGCREQLFDTSGGYTDATCGTSLAAPVVAGAAALHIDRHRDDHGSIPDPGSVYVNLLLMGDRQAASGYRTTRFDGLWGAGRLQTRYFNDAGMDAPAFRASGSVCVDHAEDFILPIDPDANGVPRPIPSDADYLKAALWWYDHRHGDAPSSYTVDNIDLRLQRDTGYPGAAVWSDVAGATSNAAAKENKEFLFQLSTASTLDDRPARLRIKGTNVTSDDEGCGTNSMLVYWAYFYEDSDRDDANGPSAAAVDPEDEH
jgi:hypothetical protein